MSSSAGASGARVDSCSGAPDYRILHQPRVDILLRVSVFFLFCVVSGFVFGRNQCGVRSSEGMLRRTRGARCLGVRTPRAYGVRDSVALGRANHSLIKSYCFTCWIRLESDNSFIPTGKLRC